MQLDYTDASKNDSTVIRSFFGLNRTRKGNRGEMEASLNMGTWEYPCAAPRPARRYAAEIPGSVSALCAPDLTDTDEITGFTGIADGAFYYNGIIKSGQVRLDPEFKWEIIRLGNLYVMNGFCDSRGAAFSVMYYYNIDTKKFGEGARRMGDLIVTTGKNSTGNYLKTFRLGFDAVKNYSVTDNFGRVINNADFFDTYGNGYSLPSKNIFEEYFSVGDELKIEGFPAADNSVGQVWQYSSSYDEVYPQYTAYDENNTVDTDSVADIDSLYEQDIVKAVVKSFEVGTVSISGVQRYVHYIYLDLRNKNDEAVSFSDMNLYSHYCSGVSLSAGTHTFNHIAAHHNRIWGAVPSGNMLYASASDSLFSFSSADIAAGYAARLPSAAPGAFTALCELGTELAAFKADSITLVFGSNPLNYSTSVLSGMGCISPGAAAAAGNTIYFLSYGGFCSFSGNTPVYISDKLNTRYKSARCGCDGERLYAAAVSDGGDHELLTYDLKNRIWHRWSDDEPEGIFSFKGGTYIAEGGAIWRIGGGDEVFDWSFTTVRNNEGTLNYKAVNEIWIRAQVEEGASFTVETCAGDNEFMTHASFSSPGLHVFRCPVRAVMADSYRCRISGRGKVVIYELEIRTAPGGRRYKVHS